jgi:cytochrome c-type biogenesis protein CcmH/NrfG
MKTKKKVIMMLFFFAAGSLLNACSTPQKVVPSKPSLPRKQAPKLGEQPFPGRSTGHSQKVLSDLKNKAKEEMKAGEPDQAFSTLERALRINPNDPVIWNMLAEIQLKRGNAEQAEQLARKSNLLVGKDKILRRRNWLIIAQALEKKGLAKEAATAKRRADKY